MITGVIAVVTKVIIFTIPKERAIPMIHPITVRSMDSTKNCSMISRFFAPIAFRIPISLVLSETVTRRIFMTPIPQTMSEIAAIPQRNVFRVVVMLESVSSVSAWLEMVKFALLASVIFSAPRSVVLIASFGRPYFVRYRFVH